MGVLQAMEDYDKLIANVNKKIEELQKDYNYHYAEAVRFDADGTDILNQKYPNYIR